MKVNKIILYNIGPYYQMNEFVLENNQNNIVLIGGKNGAGKTTFFKSIKTCLYGCKVWGFDSVCKDYYEMIDSLINTTIKMDSDYKAYVEMELYFDDGKIQNIYTIHREWLRKNKGYQEIIDIYKNNVILEFDEKNNFINYLSSLIPQEMFNFYFFDGESIADYFLGADGNKNFKNAFLVLYNLDTISIMIDNFERNIKKSSKDSQVFENYHEIKHLFTKCKDDVENQKSYIKSLSSELSDENMKLNSLIDSYSKEGGISIDKWKDLNSQMIREEAFRDDINKRLKEIANNDLPFLILHDELNSLRKSLEISNLDNQKEAVLKLFASSKFKEYSNEKNINQSLIDEIKKYCLNREKESIFDVSTSEYSIIINQVNKKLSYDNSEIYELVSSLNKSLTKSKKLRDAMNSSSIEGYESFLNEKNIIESNIARLNVQLERENNVLFSLENNLLDMQNKYDSAKNQFELLLKNNSVNCISTNAAAAYTILLDKLVERQRFILQKEFIKCFKSLINKDSFLDGVIIDQDITVKPYKYMEFDVNKIDSFLNKKENIHFLDNFSYDYKKDILSLNDGIVDSITLPVIIKAEFSQGEKQVFIMALYLALMKTSKKDIPFFIDTPFARIDSIHRKNIINTFFRKLSNQFFILSTDEEFIGKYKKYIDDLINEKFLLKVNKYGETIIMKGSYFGDK